MCFIGFCSQRWTLNGELRVHFIHIVEGNKEREVRNEKTINCGRKGRLFSMWSPYVVLILTLLMFDSVIMKSVTEVSFEAIK